MGNIKIIKNIYKLDHHSIVCIIHHSDNYISLFDFAYYAKIDGSILRILFNDTFVIKNGMKITWAKYLHAPLWREDQKYGP